MHDRHGISRRDLDDLYPRMRDAHDYLSRRDSARDNGERSRSLVNNVVRPMAAAAAGAAATGLITGRLNHWNFPGTPIPIGLTLAVAGQAIDYFGIAGPYGKDFSAAGLGAFASWINMLSTGWGQQLRARAGEPLGPITAGIAGANVGCAACNSIGGIGGIGCACNGARMSPVVPVPALPLPTVAPFGVNGARPRPLTEAEIAAMSHEMRRAA